MVIDTNMPWWQPGPHLKKAILTDLGGLGDLRVPEIVPVLYATPAISFILCVGCVGYIFLVYNMYIMWQVAHNTHYIYYIGKLLGL